MWENVRTLLGIEEERSQHKKDNGLHLAAAALMVHVSKQDDNFCADEKEHLLHSLQSHFGLSKVLALELVGQAEDDHAKAIDLYSFTKVVTKELNQEERQDIVRLLWRVAHADEKLIHYETTAIKKISDLLGVSTRVRVLLKQEVINS